MNLFKRLFGFFFTEFTGAVILLIAAFLFALVPRVYSARQNAREVEYNLDSAEVAQLILLEEQEKKSYSRYYGKSKMPKKKWDKLKWVQSKGYKFKSYKDLSEYTGVSIEELKDEKIAALLYPEKYKGPIDINKADTTQWKGLKGVGSKLALRIVKFRNSLGGFHSINQLKTVWGLDSNVIKSQMDRFVLEPNSWNKININTSTEQELAKHPYIGKYDAIKIIRFRNEHPDLTRASFSQIKSIKPDRLERMMTYFSF